MSPVTASTHDFRSESPVHPQAAQLLPTLFDEGWQDPSKIHHDSAKLALLVNQAREEIAANLGLHPDEVEFVGELGFAMWSGFAGLLDGKSTELIFSSIDRQLIHAFAREHQERGGVAIECKPDHLGAVDFTQVPFSATESHRSRLYSWQATNRETGIEQSTFPLTKADRLFADMTGALPDRNLPDGWDIAVWDPRAFAGFQGIAIIGISKSSRWKSPFPKVDKRRLFGTFSRPLMIATSLALTAWISDFKRAESEIAEARKFLSETLRQKIPGLVIAPGGDPRFLALGIPNLIAEELLRKVEGDGFLIDAGSACGAGALSPSHVLDSLGMKDLAHIRITLKSTQTLESVNALAQSLIARSIELQSN